VIHHPESVIEGMNDWCKEHHGKSGLTQRVRESTVSLAEAEQQVRGGGGEGAATAWGGGVGRWGAAPTWEPGGVMPQALPPPAANPQTFALAPPHAPPPPTYAPLRRFQVLEFVQAHTDYKSAQLAGNSVHVDRMFLQRHMPALLEHMHYRIVDVSSFSEVARCAAREKGGWG
jgi:hypothetical protein